MAIAASPIAGAPLAGEGGALPAGDPSIYAEITINLPTFTALIYASHGEQLFGCGELFPGMSVTDGNINIPLSVLTPYGLTEGLADPNTGDARTLLYALCARIDHWFRELTTKPQALVMDTKMLIVSDGLPKFSHTKRETISCTVHRVRPEWVLAAEPT